jgi:PASTA domain-containing protein
MLRFVAALFRGVVAAFAGLLIAGGTLTIAADRVAPQRPTLVAVTPSKQTLTVPQVTGQAYVFAKGILQDNGFAWQVLGPVRGYAGNTVVGQEPAAGSVVVDTGAPTVTLTLERDPAYAEKGKPDNNAPYEGTSVLLPAPARRA